MFGCDGDPVLFSNNILDYAKDGLVNFVGGSSTQIADVFNFFVFLSNFFLVQSVLYFGLLFVFRLLHETFLKQKFVFLQVV